MPAEMTVVPESGAERACRIRIENRAIAVREGLKELFDDPLLHGLTVAEQGQAEIVLAEVLNNIVEHAYAQFPGETEVLVAREDGALCFHITDCGLPYPGAAMPKGDLPALDALHDMPEGGFGWYLIRRLTSGLTYRRDAGQNRLCFRIATPDPLD